MPRFAQNIKFVRRGGIYCARRRVSEANRRAAAALSPEIPPAEPGAAANRADMESAPTEVCGIAGFAFFRLVTGLAPVRRGGIYPARGCSRRRGVCGTMRASSPTEVCGVVKFAVSRVATGPARFVGEGHGPPAGPYTATFSRWSPCFPRSVGRAFTPAAPWRIQKWRVCGIAGVAFSRLAAGLAPFVGAGFIPPAGVCAAAMSPGRCKHRPLQRFVITWGRVFPVGRYASPCSVGRAFTPAAGLLFSGAVRANI